MATPKPLANYDPFFFKFFEKLVESGSVTVELSSEKEAVNIRQRLYAFREALYAQPELNPTLALVAPRIVLKVSKRDDFLGYNLSGTIDDGQHANNGDSRPDEGEVSDSNRLDNSGDVEVVQAEGLQTVLPRD